MAYVYRLFRYRLLMISTLQDCRDQVASTPVSSTVACEENAVTALAYLSQGTCLSKFVQKSIYFLFGMKYLERNSRFATTIFIGCITLADANGRVVQGVGLNPLDCLVRGFESR